MPLKSQIVSLDLDSDHDDVYTSIRTRRRGHRIPLTRNRPCNAPNDRAGLPLAQTPAEPRTDRWSRGPEETYNREIGIKEGSELLGTIIQDDGSSTGLASKPDDKIKFCEFLTEIEAECDIHNFYPKSIWHQQYNSVEYEREVSVLLECLKGNSPTSRTDRHGKNPIEELRAEDFVIYNSLDAKQCPAMFVSPSSVSMDCKRPKAEFYLDASIIHPKTGERIYVTKMRICDFSIGGFDDSCATTRDFMWLQTDALKPYDSWYLLGEPASTYRSTWEDFVWLSDFGKHLIDHLSGEFENGRHVNLDVFRTQFLSGIMNFRQKHGHEFQTWHVRARNCKDFGKHVVRHGEFLKSLAATLDHGGNLLDHPLWDDIMQEFIYPRSAVDQTVVTPYVARGFIETFPKWGSSSEQNSYDLLRICDIDKTLAFTREQRRAFMRFPEFPDIDAERDWDPSSLQEPVERISTEIITQELIHKTIAVPETRDSHEERSRLALVIGVSNNKKMLRVRWLMKLADAIDALCGSSSQASSQTASQAYYPWSNELCLSDECSCHTVPLSSLQTVYETALFSAANIPSRTVMIRKCYKKQENAIIDGSLADLDCVCQDSKCHRYSRRPLVQSDSPRDSSNAPTIENISLFSGCGLFDHGLENGGNIRTISSLDNNICAIKSILANRKHNQHEVHHKCVNEWMGNLMQGKYGFTGTGYVDKVLMLAAGSSCCGWSSINAVRQNIQGQRQCSLLASVISAIEIIVPQFVVLENVPAMAEQSLGCAQAVSLLIGLGYQARVCKLSAHHYGSSTKRRRLFIIAAAPGLELPEAPATTCGDGLPSQYMTVRDAIGHLPPIDNDAWINVADPDHIPLQRWTARTAELAEHKQVSIRDIGRRIPKLPRGMNLAKSKDFFTRRQQLWFEGLREDLKRQSSSAFRRMQPDEQFNAVLTAVHCLDGRGGATVHYDQDRMVTLEESRVAQGVPNSWVLIGSISEQLKQVGNAVTLTFGEILGSAIDRAWAKSTAQHSDSPAIAEVLMDASITKYNSSLASQSPSSIGSSRTNSATTAYGPDLATSSFTHLATMQKQNSGRSLSRSTLKRFMHSAYEPDINEIGNIDFRQRTKKMKSQQSGSLTRTASALIALHIKNAEVDEDEDKEEVEDEDDDDDDVMPWNRRRRSMVTTTAFTTADATMDMIDTTTANQSTNNPQSDQGQDHRNCDKDKSSHDSDSDSEIEYLGTREVIRP